ncbi:hypothetical protein F2Q70_00045092 [Brassica cretica]|uniref:Uncharacterized protein n=1 Tax=Brassica cretica TaxID=69181 RepID=A0A8S9KL12_BRACR|nr:hypothetical protein F2Q70_00045092 [Brassica cretica]
MNHWAVQPNAFGDQSVVVCPKPRRIALRNPSLYHHPARSLRCYFSHQQVEVCESEAETDILDIILTKEYTKADMKKHVQMLMKKMEKDGIVPNKRFFLEALEVFRSRLPGSIEQE